MKLWLPVVIASFVLVACEKRSVPPQHGGAPGDSSVTDTMPTPDSMTVKASYPPTIGHDSAFGPIGSIDDSTGKFTEIPPRRP